jgi:hypothetical protein
LRVLDPQIETDNTALQEALRWSLPLSETRWIEPQPTGQLPPEIFGSPPVDAWCQAYEQADLARQQGDWPAVTQGWEDAQSAGLNPQDAVEYLPFVEGYAHSGDWARALELSRLAVQPGSQYPGMVCKLWGRIVGQTASSPEREQALKRVRGEFGCE